jgi:hypothetical protein
MDPKLQPYQISPRSNLESDKSQEVQNSVAQHADIGLPHPTKPQLPRFVGFYAVQQKDEAVSSPTNAVDESNANGTKINGGKNSMKDADTPWRAAILLEEIPPSFRQINHITGPSISSGFTSAVTSVSNSVSISAPEALPVTEPELEQGSAVGSLPQYVVNAMFIKACASLKVIHNNGYIHGDISRGNFLFDLGDYRSYSQINRNKQIEEGNHDQIDTNANTNPYDVRVIILDFERTR